MNNNDLELIINKLEDLNKAYRTDLASSFRLNYFDAGVDEDLIYILANKKGIVTFSLALIKSLNMKSDESSKDYVTIDTEVLTEGGDTCIKYIKVYPDKIQELNNQFSLAETRWSDKLWLYGIITILLLTVACFILGAIEFIKIVLNLFLINTINK